jgi:hypothetical protein
MRLSRKGSMMKRQRNRKGEGQKLRAHVSNAQHNCKHKEDDVKRFGAKEEGDRFTGSGGERKVG